MTIQTATYETREPNLARAGQSRRAERGNDALATGLGIFSLGLGLAELFAPNAVARAIGVRADDANTSVLRAAGLRELSSGLGILAGGNQAGWLRARVGGDVMDLALLGAAFVTPSSNRTRLAVATGSVLAVTALDVRSSMRASGGGARGRTSEHAVSARVHEAGLSVRKAITIRKPIGEVYAFWRELGNLPRFMRHLESVDVISERRSHWHLRGPAGRTLEWEAETLLDEPEQRIAWRTLPGGDIDHVGDVRFAKAPGARGTEVHVALHYRPPGGRAGRRFAELLKFFPKHELESDLRALKQILEAGEIIRSDASMHRLPHPARPPKKALAESSTKNTTESRSEGGAR